jgi:hypothetical protein
VKTKAAPSHSRAMARLKSARSLAADTSVAAGALKFFRSGAKH